MFYSNDQTLGKELFDLYQAIVEKVEKKSKEFPMTHQQDSRDNLLAYLYAKDMMDPSFVRTLEDEGLSLYTGYESHVLASIERLLRRVHSSPSLAEESRNITRPQAERLMAERASIAFGETSGERQTRIMVTFDEQMVEQPEKVERLLLSGMDIVRINCAHHHPDVWKKMIECVRRAEDRLRVRKAWDKKCRIYMDLPGPKIRIKHLICHERPLKLSVSKDERGCMIQPLIGLLFAGEPPQSIGRDAAFAIQVESEDACLFDINQKLLFKDLRNRRRTLKVIEVLGPACAKVALSQTAYVQAGMVLRSGDRQLWAKSVTPLPFKIPVQTGTALKIYFHEAHIPPDFVDDAIQMTTTLPKALHHVRPGHRLYIDDGKIFAVVERVTAEYVEAKVVATGKKPRMLKEGAGINLPDSFVHLNVSALTERDLEYMPFISEHADLIGLSFVHTPTDIAKIYDILLQQGAQHKTVIAKIETRAALHHLARILLEGLKLSSFGVMIARGDLAIEVGFGNLAFVQQEIAALCRAAHIPVIWATQVLESLAKKGMPTRSEISDALLGSQAQCIMLNKGPYIAEAVEMLAKILEKEQATARKKKEIADGYMAPYDII